MPDAPPPVADPGGRVLPDLSNLELVALLRDRGFEGAQQAAAVARLVAYATGTLRRAVTDGSVNASLARLGRPVNLSEAERMYLGRDRERRDDMVTDAVAAGFVILRDRGIRNGGWDPSRGADLKTYFVTGCLLALPNLVRVWRRELAARVPSYPYDPADLAVLAALDDDAAGGWIAAEELDALIDRLPEGIADVARRVAVEGVTWAQACRAEGMNPRVVEGRMRRYRTKHQPRRPEERG